MSDQDVLKRTKDAGGLPAAEVLARAARETGRSVTAMSRDILALRRGTGRINAEEYLAFRLYDDSLHDQDGKKRYAGITGEGEIDRACNDRERGRAVVKDKIAFTAMMTTLDFPVPALHALLHPHRVSFLGHDLRNRVDLLSWLTGLDGPVFGKPVDSRWSLGALSIERCDSATGMVTLLDGSEHDSATVADQVMAFAEEGYLFQERLEPHPDVAAVSGPAISCVRLLTIMTPEGPELLRAVWKLIGSGNVADNFWREGNLLAAIDPATGTVTRAASGVAFQHRSHDAHPDSGAALPGFTLPDWKDAVALACDAMTAMTGLRLVGWDIALTAKGPVIVEANTRPAFNIHQVAEGEGILDDRFMAFIEHCRQA